MADLTKYIQKIFEEKDYGYTLEKDLSDKDIALVQKIMVKWLGYRRPRENIVAFKNRSGFFKADGDVFTSGECLVDGQKVAYESKLGFNDVQCIGENEYKLTYDTEKSWTKHQEMTITCSPETAQILNKIVNMPKNFYAAGERYFGEGNYQKAVKEYEQAADFEHEPAVLKLAKCYENGWGVEKNIDRALKLYDSLIWENRSPWLFDGEKQEKKGDYLRALAIYLRVEDDGKEQVPYRIGRLYHYGLGVEKDWETAKKWYNKSLNIDYEDRNTHYNLACIYRDEKNYAKMKEHIIKVIGEARYEAFEGWNAWKGIGRPKNLERARDYYEEAAHGNSGYYYQKALVEKELGNYEEYVSDLHRVWKEASDSRALIELGTACENGIGLDVDYTEAMSWFQKAAEKENQYRKYAYWNIGRLYRDGKGVNQDYKEAMQYFLKAMELGHVEAYGEVGKQYIRGAYVEQNVKQGLDYVKQSVELGSASAKIYLATLLVQGNIVPRNLEEAYELLVSVAEDDLETLEGKRTLLRYCMDGTFESIQINIMKLFEYACIVYKSADDFEGRFHYWLNNYIDSELDRALREVKDIVAAIKADYMDAYYFLGDAYKNGAFHLEKNEAIAEALFKKAATKESLQGMLAYAEYCFTKYKKELYRSIVQTKRTDFTARKCVVEAWKQLAMVDYDDIETTLEAVIRFTLLYFGNEPVQYLGEPVIERVRAAAKGDGESCRWLGNVFRYDKSVKDESFSYGIASAWFHIAAKWWEEQPGHLVELFYLYAEALEDWDKAREKGREGIALEIPEMYYAVAMHKSVMSLDEEDAAVYMRKAAAKGHIGAQAELEMEARHRQYEREREKTRREYELRQQEERARAREREIDEKLDQYERFANAYTYGEFFTDEERALMGKTSQMDAIRNANLRDEIAKKLRNGQ